MSQIVLYRQRVNIWFSLVLIIKKNVLSPDKMKLYKRTNYNFQDIHLLGNISVF